MSGFKHGFNKAVTNLKNNWFEQTQTFSRFNPNDTDVFFDACVPGGGPVGPEL